jgi:nucleolin
MSESDVFDEIKRTLSTAALPSATVKSLRSFVLVQLQLDKDDKSSKKVYKAAMKRIEELGLVVLDAEGNVEWKGEVSDGKKRKADGKKEKKEKKAKKEVVDAEEGGAAEQEVAEPDIKITLSAAPERVVSSQPAEPQHADAKDKSQVVISENIPVDPDKNKPCGGNREGITRMFVGNLPFKVDEASLKAHFPGTVTHIKWITDKDTGRFYGSAFIEMANSKDAAAAQGIDQSELMGRKIRVNFAQAREGDVWPPVKAGTVTGGQAGGGGKRAMSEKPDGCVKLFIGNLSYDIDDDGIFKFFGTVDAEVKAVRWLHHKDSGDFKGVGYVEFWNTDACDKAATLNGKNLLGRPIRIDWTD